MGRGGGGGAGCGCLSEDLGWWGANQLQSPASDREMTKEKVNPGEGERERASVTIDPWNGNFRKTQERREVEGGGREPCNFSPLMRSDPLRNRGEMKKRGLLFFLPLLFFEFCHFLPPLLRRWTPPFMRLKTDGWMDGSLSLPLRLCLSSLPRTDGWMISKGS